LHWRTLISLKPRCVNKHATFGPIYLLIICMPIWTLGWREAALTSAACVAVSLAANGLEAYPLGRGCIGLACRA
jgi:hypothetical protein